MPSLQPHGPHIPRTLSFESWLSSLAAVKISWVPWAERGQSKAEDHKLDQEVESEQQGGWCSYCVVSEWGQDDHPLHGVHHHPPELLQDSLQNRLLTHSGKEREATDSGNGSGSGSLERLLPTRLLCLMASAFTFPLGVLYSLAIQEIHERSQHTICILSHRGPGVGGCIPRAPNLAQDLSHLSNTFINPYLEATHVPTVEPSLPPHQHWSNTSSFQLVSLCCTSKRNSMQAYRKTYSWLSMRSSSRTGQELRLAL